MSKAADEAGRFRSMLDLEANDEGASSDGDSGPQGLHTNPKPGNHPELAGDQGPAAGAAPATTPTPATTSKPSTKRAAKGPTKH
jgi:hypothetical protein